MAESIDLFFGMTGDGVVTSRINSMTRSFKGLERSYRGASRLGSLVGKAATFGSAVGAARGLGGIGQSILTPENLSLLSRYVIRPIRLDIRKLSRVIKPNFTKITDTISKLSKNLYAELKLTKLFIKTQALKGSVSTAGSLIYGYIGSKVIPFLGLAVKKVSNAASLYAFKKMQSFIGSKFRRSRYDKFMKLGTLQQLNKIVSRIGAGGIAKMYGAYRLLTGLGRVGEGFRASIKKRQAEVFKSVRTYLAKKGGRGIQVISSAAPIALAFLKNPYVILAGLLLASTAAIAVAVDRRLAPIISKITNWVTSKTSKAVNWIVRGNMIAAQTLAYKTRRAIELATGKDMGSKYSAPDVSPEMMKAMREQGIMSPARIKDFLEEHLRLYGQQFETNLEDYKKTLIDTLNKQTDARLKAIDDLLYTQYRESRI